MQPFSNDRNINRITVEFKEFNRFFFLIFFSILIESQWNLKFITVPSEVLTSDINRITVEFKGDTGIQKNHGIAYINRITVEFKEEYFIFFYVT